jgi:hypothetical protein
MHRKNKPGAGRPRKNNKHHTINLSDAVWNWLTASGNASVKIEQIVEEKMNEKLLKDLTYAVHNEVCDCDDKNCSTFEEIYDWLYNADNPAALTMDSVPDLVKEWKEYAGE